MPIKFNVPNFFRGVKSAQKWMIVSTDLCWHSSIFYDNPIDNISACCKKMQTLKAHSCDMPLLQNNVCKNVFLKVGDYHHWNPSLKTFFE
jgi:hypothetical protein